MKLLDGSELAGFIKERQAKAVRNLRQTWKVIPRLAIIQTIESPVIDTYVRLKRQYAEDILVETDIYKVDQSEVRSLIERLNSDESVHGIIEQLPLENDDETDEIVQLVASEKDVDGLGSSPKFDPATPLAIQWLLTGYGVDLSGKKLALVGHGRLVGQPLERLWKASGLEVQIFDKGDDLTKLREYDVVVTATGQPGVLRSEFIQVGATVVDAGTADDNGQVVGDVAVDIRERDDLTITPEKGGVGPLTIAALLDNVITAARRVADTTRG